MIQLFIDAEISARNKQDHVIQSSINAETSERKKQDNNLQSLVDTINAQPRFAAEIRSSPFWHFLPVGDITNFTEIIDVGNNFDPMTGVFAINEDKEEGVYKFQISVFKDGRGKSEGLIIVLKNQDWAYSIYDWDNTNSYMMNSVFTLHLQKGDNVELRNGNSDSIAVIDTPLTFTGYKI